MQAQGATGPQVNTDGSTPNLRVGRLGELVCADSIGKYYELARRGQLFMGSMQAGAALGTALTATAVTLTLYNPLGSQVNLSIVQCAIALTTLQAASLTVESSFVYAASLGMSTGLAPTATTPAKIYGGLLTVGTGTQGVGQLYTAATLGATAPVVVRVHPFASSAPTQASAAGGQGGVDYVEGSLVLGPGVAVTIQGLGLAMTGIVSLVWGEIPN